MNGNIELSHILLVTSLMFFIGIYGFITRRNLITMLMSVELLLNAVAINFVAFNKFLYPEQLHGILFTLFIVAVAAAEVAIAIAIIIHLFRIVQSINVEDTEVMKY